MKRELVEGRSSPCVAPGGPDRPAVVSGGGKRNNAPRNRVRRVRTGSCVWCGRRIKRQPGTRGPLPRACPTCGARVLLRRRLRAYLRTARHYALRLRRRDLALALGRVIRTLDGERPR